ncbi:hypothetical protein FNH22_13955 [Fulvivirga sp. M361]|uniref:hypothetical protein n=1 Tax=Fulvivirga sp. M361 TaxID=2594266 RepID=UPI001179C7AF|nr:hypothetical protein [Fulvivirga sp. M361]TRX58445.1 hypothetical protein FNH22_13955 [Fulvivirga sp. M361]
MKIVLLTTVLAMCSMAFKPVNAPVVEQTFSAPYEITITSGEGYLYLNSGVQLLTAGQSYIASPGESGAIAGKCGNSISFCVSYGSSIINTSALAGPCYSYTQGSGNPSQAAFTFQAAP